MKTIYLLLSGLLINLTFVSCQTHLNRYVTVYDQTQQQIKAKVVFQTFDWNGLLGTMNNGWAVATTSSSVPVRVKIPDHKEIGVDVNGIAGTKIRLKGEGDVEFYEPLLINTKNKTKPSGYSILISKDPQKTWRDFQRGVSNCLE